MASQGTKSQYWETQKQKSKFTFILKSYLATFACYDSIVNTRTSVSTDFAWNNFDVCFSWHRTEVFSETHFVVILTCRAILTRIWWYHWHFYWKLHYYQNSEKFLILLDSIYLKLTWCGFNPCKRGNISWKSVFGTLLKCFFSISIF